MQLDRITIALRPRTPREAIDLGTKLLRANARAVWSAWFVVTAPAWVLLNVGFGLLGRPWLALLAMWWLKPAFDRLPLYVFSRTLFGETPGWRATLRGQRAWRWGPTLAQILWLRLDSTRALRLPLVFLEGLRGGAARDRWRVLRGPLVGQTAFLTYGCMLFELAFYAGLWMLAAMLVPSELWPASRASLLRSLHALSSGGLVYASNLAAYLAMSVIEPLYVAAGFALYINRRTQLECWDLDLAFRRLGARAAASLMLLLACLAFVPTGARAAGPVHRPAPGGRLFRPVPSDQRMRLDAAASAVSHDPLLGRKVTRRQWQWRIRPQTRTSTPSSFGPWVGWFGSGVRLLLFVLAGGVVIVLAVALARRIRFTGGGARARGARPATVDDLQLREAAESRVPDDLAGAVRGLWEAGHPRAALALLYRGTAEAVYAAAQMDWSASATEADCMRCARQLPVPAHGERARAIVRTWQAAAYADRMPDANALEEMLSNWPLRTAETRP